MERSKFKVSQLLLLTLLGVTGINAKPPSAVVRGDRAGEDEFPYMVGLAVQGQHMCGGAIIDSTHILTAAHCVKLKFSDLAGVAKAMTVFCGSNIISKGNHHRIKSIQVHPDFAPSDTWKNDIAVITLRDPLEFGKHVKPVELPKEDTPVDVMATASGWGDLSYPKGRGPKEMWKLDMNIIPNGRCVLGKAKIHDTHLCAYAKYGSGLCSGDSGGPLVRKGVVYGVASFVMPCGVGYPDVFTRVHDYVDWIEEATKN